MYPLIDKLIDHGASSVEETIDVALVLIAEIVINVARVRGSRRGRMGICNLCGCLGTGFSFSVCLCHANRLRRLMLDHIFL